ncbi:MAG TPA: VWA domain-containing protein [Thermoanaerobaculia bacterium]|jgi:Ca-activated chloride channel family protein|nr:VWA domain-containing protein [Thermoanaerobaculia bacterium]
MRHRYSYLDPDLIRQLLAEMGLRRLFNHLLLQSGGDVNEAMRWMRALQDRGYIDPNVDLDAFFARLMEDNVIGQDAEGNVVLAAGGERQIRRDALDEIFGGLQKSISGSHSVANPGQGSERLTETRPYQFGDDPLSIDSIRSLQNAMKHTDPDEAILMTEDDLEVFETEHNSSCATVVMIDISHSMVLYGEDRITPAKKVALALTELILTKYPKDSIDVLLFGDEATEVPISRIPYVEVGPFHTNTKAGLELAQRILRRHKHNNKQIFMITDGKPSALTENGHLYTNSFGLDMKIVNRTLEEADRCRRANIPITTFMLATDPMLVNFVEQLSKINRGRAFYSSPDRLGEYILADYIRNRRKFVH